MLLSVFSFIPAAGAAGAGEYVTNGSFDSEPTIKPENAGYGWGNHPDATWAHHVNLTADPNAKAEIKYAELNGDKCIHVVSNTNPNVSYGVNGNMAAGSYTLTLEVYNESANGNFIFDVFNVSSGLTRLTPGGASVTKGIKGGAWTKVEVPFTVSNTSDVVFRLYNLKPGNFYVDDVSIVKTGDAGAASAPAPAPTPAAPSQAPVNATGLIHDGTFENAPIVREKLLNYGWDGSVDGEWALSINPKDVNPSAVIKHGDIKGNKCLFVETNTSPSLSYAVNGKMQAGKYELRLDIYFTGDATNFNFDVFDVTTVMVRTTEGAAVVSRGVKKADWTNITIPFTLNGESDVVFRFWCNKVGSFYVDNVSIVKTGDAPASATPATPAAPATPAPAPAVQPSANANPPEVAPDPVAPAAPAARDFGGLYNFVDNGSFDAEPAFRRQPLGYGWGGANDGEWSYGVNTNEPYPAWAVLKHVDVNGNKALYVHTFTNPSVSCAAAGNLPAGSYTFTMDLYAETQTITAFNVDIFDVTSGAVRLQPSGAMVSCGVKKGEWSTVTIKFDTVTETDVVFRFFPNRPGSFLVDNVSIIGEGVTAPATPFVKKEVTFKAWDPAELDKYKIEGLMINTDSDNYLRSTASANATVESIIRFAKQHAGTHITDYFMALNTGISTYPSEVWDDLADKYYQTVENGVPVNYQSNAIIRGAHHVYETLGTDYIQLFVDSFREVGINPWLDYRMNDAHYLTDKTNAILSNYFHENPGNRRVLHHAKPAYYDYCQNYGLEAVREHYLAFINESLNRYDPYGICLDFQREIWLWHIGGEYAGIDILNGFMREVDRIVSVYEEKYGHEIQIAVRVASDVETNLEFGLDVMTWAQEGIIDWVIPTGRWSTNDFDMPIRLWDSLLTPYGVKLAAGIEVSGIQSHPSAPRNTTQTLETLAAAAANGLSQGADKVYVFNYFRTAGDFFKESDKITTNDTSVSINDLDGYWNVITTIGSLEKMMTLNRRSILTFSDINPQWDKSNAQLPKNLLPKQTATLRIPVGNVPEGAALTLKISAHDEFAIKKPPVVTVNGYPCTLTGTENCANNYTADKLLCYEIPAEANSQFVTAVITADELIKINYAEVYLDVNAGK